MASSYKRLGATVIVADTDTTLYTVPSSTSAIISSIAVCNKGASLRTFRIAHVDGAIGSVANEDYIFYDVPIPANDTFIVTIGIAMSAGHTILVRANHADVTFMAWGCEIV